MKNFITKNKRWLIWLGVLAILLVGAYLRLYKISQYMTFLGDEGRDVMVVKRMIVDRKFTLLGPTASVGGFFLGPIYYYFMLPFLWLWNLDPTGPAVMVALFGIATIYLVFRVGHDFFGPVAGLVAASIYALSPVVIAFSRASWNPNLVPFFSTFIIWLLWRIVAKRRWKELFWIGMALGIGLQLHYLFMFLFAVCAVWLLLYGRSKDNVRYYLLGIVGFVIGYGPFLAFELRHGFPNTQSIVRFLIAGKETGFTVQQFFSIITDVSFRLFGRLLLRYPQPEMISVFSPWKMTSWIIAVKALLFGSIGLLLYHLGNRWRGARRRVDENLYKAVVLCSLWFFIVSVLLGFYKKGIYDYYFGIFFALPFLLTGFIVSRVWQKSVHVRWVAIGIWMSLLILNWQGRPFLHAPNDQLGQAKMIAKEAFDKAGGKPFNFALVTGQNSDHAYRYFFEIWGNKPVTMENVINDPNRETVTDQLIVICEVRDCKPLGHPLWEIAGFGRAEIVGEWDVSFVKVLKLMHYKGP